MPLFDRTELENRIGLPVNRDTIAATFHPETLSDASATAQVRPLLASLSKWTGSIIFTAANADSGGSEINAALEKFVSNHDNAKLFSNLGNHVYWSVLANAGAMAATHPAASLRPRASSLPVINIGSRQDGRVRAANVIDDQ